MSVNFDVRTAEKFSKIFEAMGYLLLDFNNKPKKLDRFVGYLAMVHKDMRLNEQDIHVRSTFIVFHFCQRFSCENL